MGLFDTVTVNDEPIISSTGRVYKFEAPEDDRALVLILFGRPKVIEYIGYGLDYVWYEGFMQEHFDDEVKTQETPDGLYVWSGKMVEEVSSGGYYDEGYEVETWIKGTFTQINQDQFEDYVSGNPVWDENEWLVDDLVKDVILGALDRQRQLSVEWPPNRFKREPVI